MRLRLTILVVLILFFAAVTLLFIYGYMGDTQGGGPTTGKPLDTDKLVTAYVELAKLAETMPIGTAEYDQERQRVLAEIGVTPAQVEETLAYYNERPDLWRPIWEEIQTRLADELEEASQPARPDTSDAKLIP